ncbi:MAG: hypothetical protein KF693_01190 [Nitrospira sp.]|nr:hypothetical protein [Nitrospira sp.]
MELLVGHYFSRAPEQVCGCVAEHADAKQREANDEKGQAQFVLYLE